MSHLANPADIIRHRLFNQQLVGSKLKKPAEVVRWLGAVQAQEYAISKWALALRLPPTTDKQVEKYFNEGKILRTHVLRPTWHLVTPEDIRWLLALTSPRLHARNGSTYRQLGLTSSLLKRSTDTLAKALEGRRHHTRQELKSELEKTKINTDGLRLAHFMMAAELDGVICSGPRVGKQFTYALLDDRAPIKGSFRFDREESLANLALRYFTTRGPATIKDFATWSGLTVRDATVGARSLPRAFITEKLDGQSYIFKPGPIAKETEQEATFLMPDYDEYGMGYKDRSAIFNTEALRIYQIRARSVKEKNPIFNRMTIIERRFIQGT